MPSHDRRSPTRSPEGPVLRRAKPGPDGPDQPTDSNAFRQVLLKSRGHPANDAVSPVLDQVGLDRGDVTFHDDTAAAEAADLVDAEAFTVGTHVYLSDTCDPTTPDGRSVVAHELGHVCQYVEGQLHGVSTGQLSAPGDAVETDADRRAEAISPNLDRGRASPTVDRATGPVLRKPKKGGSKDAPAWTDRKVGRWPGWDEADLVAHERLFTHADRSTALAYARTEGQAAILVRGSGGFEVYRLSAEGWGLTRSETVHSGAAMARQSELHLIEGVEAIVTSDGFEFSPIAPSGHSPGHNLFSQDANPPSPADPLAGLLTARPSTGGSRLSGTAEDQHRQFEIALFDMTMWVLDQAEVEAHRTKADAAQGFSRESRAAIERVLKVVHPIDQELKGVEASIQLYEQGPKTGDRRNWERSRPLQTPIYQKNLARRQTLLQQRGLAMAPFPILRRIPRDEMDDFRDESWDDRGERLAVPAGKVPGAIEVTRRRFRTETLSGFEFLPLVQATLDALLVADSDPVHTWAMGRYRSHKRWDAIIEATFGLLSLGLGLGALAASTVSGPVGLALTGAAAGVAVADAAYKTEEYAMARTLSFTDIDPDEALLNPQQLESHLFWLVVAWVGVGLSFVDVAVAVHWLRSGKTLADVARQLGVPTDELLEALGTFEDAATGGGRVWVASSDEAFDLVTLGGKRTNLDDITLQRPRGAPRPASLPEELALGEEIAGGQYKVVYAHPTDADRVIGVIRPEYAADGTRILVDEAAALGRLSDLGLPVVQIHGFATAQGRPAVVMQRYAGAWKPFFYDSAMHLVQPDTIGDVRRIIQVIEDNAVFIDDIELFMTGRGSPVIADPLAVEVGASGGGVRSTVMALESFVEGCIEELVTRGMTAGRTYTVDELVAFAGPHATPREVRSFLQQAVDPRYAVLVRDAAGYRLPDAP